MRIFSAALFLLTVAQGTLAEGTHLYVSYDFFRTTRTASDHREMVTQIFLTADDYVGYRYREDVLGATTPTVQSVEFSNEYRRKATPDEQEEFARALLAAKVFDLTSDAKPSTKTDYFASLAVRINGRENRTFFHSPPRSEAQKSIHGRSTSR